MACFIVAAVSATTLLTTVTEAEWKQIECPSKAGSCSYTNPATSDRLVELNFQGMSDSYNLLRCSVSDGASTIAAAAATDAAVSDGPKDYEVCRFEAQTGQYEGRFVLTTTQGIRFECSGLVVTRMPGNIVDPVGFGVDIPLREKGGVRI